MVVATWLNRQKRKKKNRGTRRIEAKKEVFVIKLASFSPPPVSDADGNAYTSPNVQEYSESGFLYCVELLVKKN